jgi:hypothetical protein
LELGAGSSDNPQPRWLRYHGSAGFQPAGSGGILPPVHHFQTGSHTPWKIWGASQISLAISSGRLDDKCMIAAATPGKMLFNSFDVALVLLLAFGYWRGRRNGMTKEVLPMFYWVATVVVAGLGYSYLGDLLTQQGVGRKLFSGSGFKEKTAVYILAYLILAGLVRFAYTFVKKFFKPRLEGSNVFGSTEYYLGMTSGVIRYACIMLSVLALLHAPVYTAADLNAERAYKNKIFGGGVEGFSGNYIPSVSEVQALVYKDSLIGPTIKSSLRMLLINTGGGGSAVKPPVM